MRPKLISSHRQVYQQERGMSSWICRPPTAIVWSRRPQPGGGTGGEATHWVSLMKDVADTDSGNLTGGSI